MGVPRVGMFTLARRCIIVDLELHYRRVGWPIWL